MTKSAELSERIESLSPSKRRLLSQFLEDGSWDNSWLANAASAPATSPVEKELATIWQEVLGVESVGVEDNFFDLGGDSILSIRIVARGQQRGLKFTSRQLFEHPTVASLASLVTFLPEALPEAKAESMRFDPRALRAAGRPMTPQDFPDAELTQTDLDSILAQVARDAPSQESSRSPVDSPRPSSSFHRFGAELSRVQALRAARF